MKEYICYEDFIKMFESDELFHITEIPTLTKADIYKEIYDMGDCENVDCWDCAFGQAEGCLIEQKIAEMEQGE